jgi:arginyl-tRNA synthetase
MSHPVIAAALKAAFIQLSIDDLPALVPANKAGGGDLQCNTVVKFAGRNKLNGAKLADRVVAAITLPEAVARVTASGPGFINVFLGPEYLVQCVSAIADSNTLGVEKSGEGITSVVDFGGPNVAKALHVGHLRSFVIGESLRRILLETGRTVISDIHLGDHGLQMGKLLLGLELLEGRISLDNSGSWTIATLEEFYLTGAACSKVVKDASAEEKALAQDFLAKARALTEQLQLGDPEIVAIWAKMRDISLFAILPFIEKLDCHFDLMLGESDSQPTVDTMIAALKASGQAIVNEGALVVPLGGDGATPLLLVSSDNTVLYGATDLATLSTRVNDLGADEIVYCVDDRQSHHLASVFDAAKKTGLGGNTSFAHTKFGTVKGKDGKALKTRDGVPYKLGDLIEAVSVAAKAQMKTAVADADIAAVAMSALKFADLSTDRETGYFFDEVKMTAMEGKSGPYLLYAAVRIKSILTKAGGSSGKVMRCDHRDEAALMQVISEFPGAVAKAASDLKPHHIAELAYELAQAFSRFYTNVPILAETDVEIRQSRLALCAVTLKVLTRALYLLGISVPSRM